MPAKTQDIGRLLDIAENLYEVVMVVARRARQINEEFYQKKRDNQILEELEGGFDDDFLHTDLDDTDKEETFENDENPLNYAQDELDSGKIDFYYDSRRR